MDKESFAAPNANPDAAAASGRRFNGGEPNLAALVESLAALRVQNGEINDEGMTAIIERIGQLNIASPGSPGSAAFDLRNLLAALPDAAADEDLTDIVINWLDSIFSACVGGADNLDVEIDDGPEVAEDDLDGLPFTASHRMEHHQPQSTRQEPTCNPKEVFPPSPLDDDTFGCVPQTDSESECSTPVASESDDDSVATVYSPSVASFEFRRFNLKRRYGDSDIESSSSEDEVPVVKRRRHAMMPKRTRKPRRKFVRAAPSPPPSSDEESYFSDSVHVARPMSPIDGQIASNLAMYCTLHSP
ncbi:hypothetical protein AURDEDRAFT_165388 [Auricularia subglabra TFB-10046 SS5]|nr:hypothetical protein AURDEDRAFT_165388 [Auricularia subglabra TFB-10046 SS5]